ncbi:uracil phosphoribosyltransferase [Treponema lecithinolyticum]|jgi:Uracil phosphoribosyltransferase|uniref:Phosphoribosyl transferase domain protein n=1 Tax=Treponema lecithinolyticum ATCC 700332 TaxID=1321815 RepID=A0ABN0NZN0_TRELE|nr:uracil phosphoribosyltransferase [Treponema lecithinolyticum]ERJ93574.1 phosphoribosyl transferase domain protein [Treponema lecithinolyticum ATCC 700332]
MNSKVILKAEALDGYLTEKDQDYLARMDAMYERALTSFSLISAGGFSSSIANEEKKVIDVFNEMGHLMQEICTEVPALKVFSFETEPSAHAEASRVIAKLRDIKTGHNEFVYYCQRAYEMLFRMAFACDKTDHKNYLVVKTPVSAPVQNYSVHKIPDIDFKIENSVMCVMLRGALLPSMIMSKEIEEYSSHGYVTPFALFKIKRDESKLESDMEYILDLDKSFFNLEEMDGKDLIFADPMNATGGSLVTIVKYLLEQNIKPRSIKFFNVIAALKGSLRVVRALENCTCYTLWMDPVLNSAAYIMPGLGDAGDRLNGTDTENAPRNIMQLIADYGSNIAGLYRSQLRKIEQTVLDR